MKSNQALLSVALMLALGTVFVLLRVEAQVLYGSIIGDVTDASNAPIPGATVRITHLETNQSRQSTTNQAGGYGFPTIPTGTYEITINKDGFQTFNARKVVVTVEKVVRVDVTLQVGRVTESIEVTAQGAALQTDRAEVRGELTSKSLVNLPVPQGRNYQNLFLTIPGFTPPVNQHSVAANPSRGLTFNVNGTTRNSNSVRIDGASAINTWLPHVVAYVPALEAIDTVSVVTNSFDAEQGLAGGAAINVQIKSGGNDIHGSAFEYHTDNALKAKPYFLPEGESKPKTIYNQFGGVFGGPIIRNKLFYFVSYEGTYDRQTAAIFTTVPTEAIRAGNMSASPNPIYDPLTGNPDGSGRTPFENKIIPRNRWDPVSLKLLDIIPLPNIPNQLTNNYYATGAYSVTRHVVDTKINWNINEKLTVAGRFGWLKYDMINPPAYGDNGPPVSSAGGRSGHGFGGTHSTTFSANYVFRPNFIVDAYFGWTRVDTRSEPPRLEEKLGSDFLGIPGTNGPRREEGGWPQFNVTSYSLFGNPGSNGGPVYYTLPSYQYVGNVNWNKGTHNIRFGITSARQHLNNFEINTGAFTFSGGSTTIRNGPSPNQFNSFASFLLGHTSAVTRDQLLGERATARTWSHSLYIRDQWQANRKLTLSLGLRWEYFPMGTRKDRGMERYDFERNKMLICGVGDTPKDCGYKIDMKAFSPRVGIAWRPTDTFVIRAGYGLNYDPYPLAFVRNMLPNYPEVSTFSLSAPNAFQPASLLRNGIPPIIPPDISKGIIDVPVQYNVRSLPDELTRGYIQSWNLTLQKQLMWGFIGQMGYVGSRQVHIQQRLDLNAGQVGKGRDGQPFFQRFGRTAATELLTPVGHNQYDALQATLERRFAKGYQVNVAYTWSKAIGICCDDLSDGPPQIQLPEYRRLNRSLLSFDRTHNLVFSTMAELPFGKGKRWFSDGVASAIAGGWQINALFSSYSGRPFTVTASGTSLNSPGNNQRADQVKPEVKILGGIGRGQSYFDPFAFKPVTEARFGTAGFNTLRGPGAVNLDFGLFRDFRITERWKIQFRAEAFNFTNTPHFNNPGSNVSNLQLNTNGTIRSLGGYTEITSTAGTGREGIDERVFRFGLRLSF